jgi:CubicO group peptidase (beta-lactamase class C family)
MQDYEVPGLSVAIARHGQFVYRDGFGFADQDKREKVAPSHLFRIASVTKPITSVAIFSLVEKGKLNLTDLIFGSNGLLQFDYGKRYDGLVEKITLEHLLTHTCGGWGNESNDPMFSNPTMGTKDLIQWTLENVPLEEEPGTHYAYSNFGYCILGRVLEKISGQTYADFVRQEVLSKCDIKDMQIAGNTLQERSPSEVVYYGNGDDPYGFNIRRMDSHGGWIATPSDLVQFLMRVDGFSYTPNILDKKTIEIMTTPSQASASSNYAKGWAVNDVPNWWHVGSLPGTLTVIVRTASGLCWAAFTNTRTNGMDAALDQMMWKMVKSVPAWQA